MSGDIKNPDYKNWITIIPEGEMVMQNSVITKNNIIIQDKKDVQSRLLLYDMKGKKLKQINLPETGDVSAVWYDREEDSVYISLSTLLLPAKPMWLYPGILVGVYFIKETCLLI